MTTNSAKTVGLFATCLVDLIRPEVGFATAFLLENAGFEVDVPKTQTCCGQPLFNSGDVEGTRKTAKRFLDIFESYDYIVVPSGSCAATLSVHYPEIFENDRTQLSRSKRIAKRTYELTQFLTKVAEFETDSEFHSNCTYHDSCSGYRELRIYQEPRSLLSNVNGIKLTECFDSSACCGFGGTFCVKYPDISVHITQEKVQNIEQTQADTLLGGDLGCLMNIAGLLQRRGSKVQVLHVAEVLSGRGSVLGIGQTEQISS